MYYQANRRLAGLFPQEFCGTIAALEEQVRAEEWDNLRQQIADGSIAPPAGFDSSTPWATIIPASRPFFTMGLLQDWWQERIIVLDRARTRSPHAPSTASILPGVLPSFLGQPVIPELAGRSSSSAQVSAPPEPHAQSKNARKRNRQQQQPAEQQLRQPGQPGQQSQQQRQRAQAQSRHRTLLDLREDGARAEGLLASQGEGKRPRQGQRPRQEPGLKACVRP